MRLGQFYLSFATLLYNKGYREAAGQFAEHALDFEEEKTAALQLLAGMARNAMKFTMAENLMRKALARDPSNARVHAQLAAILSELRHDNEAEMNFRAAIRADAKDASIHKAYAFFLEVQRKDTLAAFREYAEAARLEPSEISGLIEFGGVHFMMRTTTSRSN